VEPPAAAAHLIGGVAGHSVSATPRLQKPRPGVQGPNGPPRSQPAVRDAGHPFPPLDPYSKSVQVHACTSNGPRISCGDFSKRTPSNVP
jgi:hypothetical protein